MTHWLAAARSVALLALVLAARFAPASGQEADPAGTPLTDSLAVQEAPPAAVVLRGDTLIVIARPLGPFSPVDRALGVRDRVRRLARDPRTRPDSVRIVEGTVSTDIALGDVVIATITDADAAALGRDRNEFAAEVHERIVRALEAETWMSVVRAVARGVLLSILALAVFWALIRALGATFPRIRRLIGFWRTTRIPSIRVQKLEIVSANRIADVLIWITKALHVVLVGLLLYFFVPLVLSFFPWTQDLADRLLDYVVQPFGRVFRQMVAYLPNLVTIAVIAIVTKYLLSLIHFVFHGIERGAIALPGFYADWAEPTYKIVRFLVLAFALIVLFPLLPGAGSQAFGGVSVFLGLLISLGSASAVGNMVAGIVITYMRPFKLGDRVKIADTVGDVVDKSLLVTRVRTVKNVDVTIPNAMVLGAHIINYSSSAAERGVVMHTAVTIGYDAPWRRVHDALLAAARDTPHILETPEPFVLQTALGDFAVSYELNAYTHRPNRMAAIYSELHQNIQDAFNRAGIEIMSPAYTALRDGNRVTLPDEHLPEGYRAPGFRVEQAETPAGEV